MLVNVIVVFTIYLGHLKILFDWLIDRLIDQLIDWFIHSVTDNK